MASGNVHQIDPHALGPNLLHRHPQQLFDMQLALTNTAPADGAKVIGIDQAPDRPQALRPVAVDVIQGAARVKTRLVAELQTAGKRCGQLQAGAVGGPVPGARRSHRQRRAQALGLVEAEAPLMRIAHVRHLCRRVELALDEIVNLAHRCSAVALAQRIVKKARQLDQLFGAAGQPLKELMLRFGVYHPVAARDQHLSRHVDGRSVGDHTIGSVVQAQQHVGRDRAGDQRVGVITCDAAGIVRQKLGLDIAVDEEVAAQRAHQLDAGPSKGNVELDLERRRSQRHAADGRRVVVHPGRNQHRPDALRHHMRIGRQDAMLRVQVRHESLDVANGGAKAGAEPPHPGRTAVASGVPGEKIKARQIQLIDQMRHAARVLMATVEQHDAAPARPHRGGPMPIEQVHTVMGSEMVLGQRALGQGVVHECDSGDSERVSKRVSKRASMRDSMRDSAKPARTRLMVV